MAYFFGGDAPKVPTVKKIKDALELGFGFDNKSHCERLESEAKRSEATRLESPDLVAICVCSHLVLSSISRTDSYGSMKRVAYGISPFTHFHSALLPLKMLKISR